MNMRYTPENITTLGNNEVFVFGSNEAGAHGAGAALSAVRRYGAIHHVGFGHTGQCFAIPTKDWDIETLPVEAIGHYVHRFVAYARSNPRLTFLVTKIGCGLAGYTIEEIAPLFRDALTLPNVILPKEFQTIITN